MHGLPCEQTDHRGAGGRLRRVADGRGQMFNQYRDRVVVAELDSNTAVEDVDIVLYDSFAQPESDHEAIAVLVANPRARRVVVYTWNFLPGPYPQCPAAGSARLPIEDVALRESW